jgi:hypothetical protein
MTFNLTIVFHGTTKMNADNIFEYLSSKSLDVKLKLVSDSQPENLSARSSILKESNALFAILNREFQNSLDCMQIIHFAKDLKKNIYGLNVNSMYVPFGALGAIICGTEAGVVELFENTDMSSVLDPILNSLGIKNSECSKIENPQTNKFDLEGKISPHIELRFSSDKHEFDILISYHSDSKHVADLLSETFESKNMRFKSEDCSLGITSIKNAKVLLLIMSKGYEENYYCRIITEMTRSFGKKIIPISTSREFKPQDWLALFLAGKLFFRIINKEQAYKKKNDFSYSQIDSLIDAVIIASTFERPQQNEAELKLIESLNRQIKDFQKKLGHWPPKSFVEDEGTKVLTPLKRTAIRVELKERTATLYNDETNYQVKQAFHPPRLLFDKFGVPLREKFDCMISYQWDHQNLVKDIYMNLRVRNLLAWFDIWAGMNNNVNDSMATAVECSRVLLVFLSKKYLSSPNCKLEFKYAINCGKPFVFILLEKLDNLILDNYIKQELEKWPKFELNSTEDFIKTKVNGIPKCSLITQAVRDVAAAQIDYDLYELNEEIFKLKLLINLANKEFEEVSEEKVFKTCTRCKKNYDDNSNKIGDCKIHLEYFLPGYPLMEDRWTCCMQQDQDSFGCCDAKHIDLPREWTLMEPYGTYNWKPK